jgi:EAL domain-containing protein (putative c-di-GMP-specific phosphodiesterase class I)
MYTEKIERIQRFKLALRMGIPIFLLAGVLLFSLLTQYLKAIPVNFIIIIVGLLAVAVYFQFYLIYQGFNERITDTITHTFTPEYLEKIFNKRKKKTTQSIILYSINNIADINERFGIKNGDKLLYNISQIIDEFFQSKGIKKLILSHYKAGDFIILLEGEKSGHRLLFDIFSTKMGHPKIEGIEIQSCSALVDTKISQNFEKLIDRLFELQLESQKRLEIIDDDKTDLNELESSILESLKAKRFSIMAQKAEYEGEKILDVSVKLIDAEDKFIHQKRFLPIITRLGRRAEYELAKIQSIVSLANKYTHFTYAISVAAEVVRDHQFQLEIESLISDCRESSLMFILEEKEYFSNIKRFDYIIQNYRKLGIKIVLDGLANNPTTQLYMKDLHVDMVRFDGSYGKNIDEDRYQNIVEGLNLAAQKMGLLTWIRLIKDKNSADLAKKLGIDIISGHYISKVSRVDSLVIDS